jgi:hypothetical protein
MMPKCATAGVCSTRVMEVRRRSIAEWQMKGVIVERRAEGLTQKGHKGTYEKGLSLYSKSPSNIDVIDTGEGPCTTCATWTDGIFEVAHVCGVDRCCLSNPRVFGCNN